LWITRTSGYFTDINNFTSTFLEQHLPSSPPLWTLHHSFSGILFYPPLFVALVIYAVGGTAASFHASEEKVRPSASCAQPPSFYHYGR
jgi:hypothetical protein